MGFEEIIASASFQSLIDAIIVFLISFFTQLLALGGIPTPEQLYLALLMGALTGLVLYAKKRKIEYPMNGK